MAAGQPQTGRAETDGVDGRRQSTLKKIDGVVRTEPPTESEAQIHKAGTSLTCARWKGPEVVRRWKVFSGNPPYLVITSQARKGGRIACSVAAPVVRGIARSPSDSSYSGSGAEDTVDRLEIRLR